MSTTTTTPLQKWKQLVKSFSIGEASSDDTLSPEIGFRCFYCEEQRRLVVRIIGARHFPTLYGSTRPFGYLIKVRVSPGRDRYETQIVKDSDPVFNEEFNFDLQPTGSKLGQVFVGKFVTFVAYALLSNEETKGTLTRKSSFSNQLKGILGINSRSENGISRPGKFRISINNKRTIGAVVYNLEKNNFTQKARNCLATPDIWREVQNVTSGLKVEPKDDSKGSLELTLCYSTSEDGNNEMVQVTLSRFRCSIETMQEHEKFGGSLYFKMTAYEYDVLIASWKSNRFEPTISMRIEPKTATLQAVFRNYNVNNIKIVIRVMCRNLLAKKIMLGKIEIDNKSEIWKQIVQSPSIPVTEMLNLQ